MSTQKYRSYKDVPIPWIASIPEHWDWKPVLGAASERDENNKGMKEDNLLSLSYGNIVNKDINTSDGLLPESFETYQIVRPGDIVLRLTDLQNDKRSLRSALVTQTGIITSAYLALKPKSIDPKYLGFLLRAYDVSKVFYSMGGGLRQSMKYVDIKRMPLVIPTKAEQSQIATFLDRETAKIDTLIGEQQRLIELLQEKRQAVISHAVTKGLNPNAPMKDSGVEWLGEVPEHWDVTRIKNIGRGVIGLTYSPSEITDEQNGIPVLRASNVQNGLLDWQDMVIVSRHIDPELIIKPGDILICARSGSRDLIGKNALISQEDINGPTTFGAFMTVLRCIDPLFLRWTLASTVFKAQSGAYMSTTINQLTQTTLMNTVIVLPPEKERRDICDFLESKARDIDCLSTEAGRSVLILQERRSSIISAAVTGQIDVRGLVEAEACEQ